MNLTSGQGVHEIFKKKNHWFYCCKNDDFLPLFPCVPFKTCPCVPAPRAQDTTHNNTRGQTERQREEKTEKERRDKKEDERQETRQKKRRQDEEERREDQEQRRENSEKRREDQERYDVSYVWLCGFDSSCFFCSKFPDPRIISDFRNYHGFESIFSPVISVCANYPLFFQEFNLQSVSPPWYPSV